MTPYIKELQDVIFKLHGAQATHRSSVHVKEEFQGQIVWDGAVEVFDLTGHPDANIAYAWSHDTATGKKRTVAVLHVPPIESPEAAVKAAIVQEFRNGKS